MCLDMSGDSSVLIQVEDNRTGDNRILQTNVKPDIGNRDIDDKCTWNVSAWTTALNYFHFMEFLGIILKQQMNTLMETHN